MKTKTHPMTDFKTYHREMSVAAQAERVRRELAAMHGAGRQKTVKRESGKKTLFAVGGEQMEMFQIMSAGANATAG